MTAIDREKLLSLTVGRGRRDGDRRETAREWRSDDGERHVARTDELGNTVTQHARPNSTEDRQDVHIRAPLIKLKAGAAEETR